MKRWEAETRGRKADSLAASWLRLHDWRIHAQRARVHGGEVDLVARRGKNLAFVEVTARATAEAADFSLDQYRLRRVPEAAHRLAPRFVREGDDLRIDAVFIVPRSPRPGMSPMSGTGDKSTSLS